MPKLWEVPDGYYNEDTITNKMKCDCFQQGKEIIICLCCGACRCGERSGLAEHELYGLEDENLLSLELRESHREYWE